MCGIAGFIDTQGRSDRKILADMTDCISYRGPDASGYGYFDHNGSTIGLGHRRLAIIDCSPLGNQPMYANGQDAAIILNGEVYNYAEVKRELIELGYTFTSQSDTEVILKAYLQWGVDSVHRFVGMFVYIIYDKAKEKVLFFRDRPGVKPLYYYWKDGVFLYASELKPFFTHPSFKKQIDKNSVYNFLQYGNIPAPYSIFENTFKLEPAHYLSFDLKKKSFEQIRYWNVYDYYKKPVQNISEQEAIEELQPKLKTAFQYRMVSDVPVGLFLSGGYDSSLVAAILQSNSTEKIKTYTIGFADQDYNEAVYAKKVAEHLGTDHHELYCTYDDAKSIIPDLPYFYDEPFGDSSAIPTILVSRFARKHVTVALSADGGDETFGGYTKYVAISSINNKKNRIPKALRTPLALGMKATPGFVWKMALKEKNVSTENIDKYIAFLEGKHQVTDMLNFANMVSWPGAIKEVLNFEPKTDRSFFNLEEIKGQTDDFRQMLALDYMSYLPNDILTKVDRATMSISLEGREPLLDHNIIEWVATLPSDLKYRNGTTKYISRQIVHKYLPKSLMERPKMGFTIPLVEWFRGDMKYLFEESLSQKNLNIHGLMNTEAVQKKLNGYYQGDNFSFPLLWNIFMFQKWFEKWM